MYVKTSKSAARKWAKKMGIDPKVWPGGLKDLTKALTR